MALHQGHSESVRPSGVSNSFVTEANPALGQRLMLPAHRLASNTVPADIAYQLVHDDLLLDGSARLNLATFVTTWMEPQAAQLMAECLDKNMIDKDEYPRTADLEQRCVSMLAQLWHAPAASAPTGCSTTGPSEACMLAGLALKRRWQHARRAQGRPMDRPNLVMGINVQVCWEKFCRYWDVEPRLVPMEGDRFHLGPQEAVAHCDENKACGPTGMAIAAVTIAAPASAVIASKPGTEPLFTIASPLCGFRHPGLDPGSRFSCFRQRKKRDPGSSPG